MAQRQTLLFSATFPSDVRALSQLALKPKHATVDAIGDGAWRAMAYGVRERDARRGD